MPGPQEIRTSAACTSLRIASDLKDFAPRRFALIPDLNSLVGYSSTMKCYKLGFLACLSPFVHSAFKERWTGRAEENLTIVPIEMERKPMNRRLGGDRSTQRG